ncbi:MAG: FAD-dependent monooxygenase, partial [Gammaproteobacteria bacterium]
MSEYNTEVVIAGAGLAGATLANLLSRNGIRCVVVDTAGPGQPGTPVPPVPRALSITPASARILSAINVWQKLPQENTGYFTGIHVWDENSPGEIHFDSKDI